MKNKNYNFFRQSLVAGALLLSGFVSAQEKEWTLTECVNYALDKNISVQQSKNAILSGEQDVLASKGRFLPSVSAGVNYNLSVGTAQIFTGRFVDQSSNTIGGTIGARQTIFNGFRNLYIFKQAKLKNEINTLELARIKDNISLNVVNAYLNVMFNIENLGTAKAQYTFSEEQLKRVKELVNSGAQPEANIYDAEATLSSDLQRVTIAQNNYDLALLSLSQLLQLPLNNFKVAGLGSAEPSSELLYDNVQPVLDYAFTNRNEVKIAEKTIENAKLSTKIAKSGYLPTLSANYNFGSRGFYTNLTNTEKKFITQIQNNKVHTLGASLSIPIFSQYQNKTSVAKSRIQEENAILGLEQAKLTLENTIQRVFTDAKAALRSFEAAEKSLKSQNLAFNNAKERYSIGAMNAFDLEQSRVRFINAKAALINAKYDFVFKTKVLDFYLGKPITE